MAAESAGATKPRMTQRERSAATVEELLTTARRLFVERGYADTSLEQLVREVGVTKGALYHHFSSKRDLFRAVYEREQQSLTEICTNASRRRRDLRLKFLDSLRAFFEASLDPGVRRITLIDAPGALGWEEMREVESRYTLALIVSALELAMDRGRMARRPVEPLAHLVFGAACEGVMLCARSDDQDATAHQVLADLDVLIAAFFD
jgi:AcrR family transcriptional regulator